jgi:hypothetical protein
MRHIEVRQQGRNENAEMANEFVPFLAFRVSSCAFVDPSFVDPSFCGFILLGGKIFFVVFRLVPLFSLLPSRLRGRFVPFLLSPLFPREALLPFRPSSLFDALSVKCYNNAQQSPVSEAHKEDAE